MAAAEPLVQLVAPVGVLPVNRPWIQPLPTNKAPSISRGSARPSVGGPLFLLTPPTPNSAFSTACPKLTHPPQTPFSPTCPKRPLSKRAVRHGCGTLPAAPPILHQALTYNAIQETMSGQTDRRPGDFSMDPFKMADTPEKAKSMLEKEISHARLAMMAFSGVVTQSALTGHGFPYLS